MDLPKALFIADERSARGVLGEMLRDCGYQVVTCPDQLTGLRALARESFDVTIVNLDAPTLDPLSFLQALESRDIDTVLILRSDGLETELVPAALRAGADDLVRISDTTPEAIMAHINHAMMRRHRMRHRHAPSASPSSNSTPDLLQLASKTARALQGATTLEDTISPLLEGCQEGMNCDTAALLLLDAAMMMGDLYLHSRLSLSPETVNTLKRDLVERAANLVGTGVEAHRIRLHRQSYGQHPILSLPAEELFQTFCAAPLVAQGETMGLLVAAAAWPDAFREDQMRFLNILASLGAAAIRNFYLTAHTHSALLLPH